LEFLSEYGLFLLKAVTIVVAIVVVVSFIVAAGMKGAPGKDRGIREEVLDEKAMKAWHKSKKKEDKANKKKADVPRKKRVYVLGFDGDIKASETDELKESITAVLSLAEPEDEVVCALGMCGSSRGQRWVHDGVRCR